MMRVTQQRDGETMTLKIEGALAGEWTDEVKRCWDEVKNDARLRVIRIDLTGVTFIDAAGRDWPGQISFDTILTQFAETEPPGWLGLECGTI